MSLLGRKTRWKAYSRAYRTELWKSVISGRERLFKKIAVESPLYLAHGTILDVGTGPGRLPLLMTEGAPNVKCIGIDLEPILLNDGRRKALTTQAHNRPSFILSDVQALPFRDQSFDMVISTMSLHQWPNRQKGATELLRVLKDGGIAIIFVGRIQLYPGKVGIFDFVMRKSAKCLASIFESAGFKDIKITYPQFDLLKFVGRK